MYVYIEYILLKVRLSVRPAYRLNFRADPKRIHHFAGDVTKVGRIERVAQPNLRYRFFNRVFVILDLKEKKKRSLQSTCEMLVHEHVYVHLYNPYLFCSITLKKYILSKYCYAICIYINTVENLSLTLKSFFSKMPC